LYVSGYTYAIKRKPLEKSLYCLKKWKLKVLSLKRIQRRAPPTRLLLHVKGVGKTGASCLGIELEFWGYCDLAAFPKEASRIFYAAQSGDWRRRITGSLKNAKKFIG